MRVPFSFLKEQFADPESIFERIRVFLKRCDFTLGQELQEFEKQYAASVGARFAIGVGSGTDALALSLKALGIGPGDEVIVPAHTFIATVGAVVQVGARPVFVDAGRDHLIDASKIAAALTSQTRALLPVHWAGAPAAMPEICKLAEAHGLVVVEDACQALGARINGQHVGTFGAAGAFSVHPLKPLHVWGDGGMIVTNDAALDEKLRLIRNHGMQGRDVVALYGVNSRFDNLQAIVGLEVIKTLDATIDKRISHARRYDKAFAAKGFAGVIEVPPRQGSHKHVVHLYIVTASRRDELLQFLKGQGIDAKVHYPIPQHLQPAAEVWGHKVGDFPMAEHLARNTITLPCHQYLSEEQIDYTISKVAEFYGL